MHLASQPVIAGEDGDTQATEPSQFVWPSLSQPLHQEDLERMNAWTMLWNDTMSGVEGGNRGRVKGEVTYKLFPFRLSSTRRIDRKLH